MKKKEDGEREREVQSKKIIDRGESVVIERERVRDREREREKERKRVRERERELAD